VVLGFYGILGNTVIFPASAAASASWRFLMVAISSPEDLVYIVS
jgi:hypothetical protein